MPSKIGEEDAHSLRSSSFRPHTHCILTMLAKNSLSLARRRLSKTVQWQAVRAQSTESNSPIAQDGRHEVWREGIYDHDNEPK